MFAIHIPFAEKTRPLLTYGLLYAGVIVLFATLYWMLPGQFYHSTAMYEPVLAQDEIYIKTALQHALREQGQRNFPQGTIKVYGTEFPIVGLTVGDVSYEHGEFIVSVTIENRAVWSLLPPIHIQPQSTVEVTIDQPDEFAIINASPYVLRRTRTEFSLLQNPFQHTDQEIGVPFGASGNFRTADSSGEIEAAPGSPETNYGGLLRVTDSHGFFDIDGLRVSRRLLERMQAYADAKDGFAGRASGSFWRMLYLSTVTITTVGYGDTVPITPWARTLIAVEAVLGIVIIGLYLNALSERLRPQNAKC